ncbi:MAG TPA: hypothetical protein VKP69_11440, partial [Isosphaeraceae bacterium]|nr:hypothetical protein [Isosphaeraceae bacterium]
GSASSEPWNERDVDTGRGYNHGPSEWSRRMTTHPTESQADEARYRSELRHEFQAAAAAFYRARATGSPKEIDAAHARYLAATDRYFEVEARHITASPDSHGVITT